MLWEEGDGLYINGIRYSVIPDASDPACATVPDVEFSNEGYSVFYTRELHDNRDGLYHVRTYGLQDYREGSFGQYANPMAGYGTSTDITLKNLCGILKVGITSGDGRSLASVSLCNNMSRRLDGFLTVSRDDLVAGNLDNIIVNQDMPQYRDVTIRCPEEGVALFGEPQYFYFVIPADTYPEGLMLSMVDTEGKVSIAFTSDNMEIGRSVIKEMPALEFVEAEPLSVTQKSVSANDVIYTFGSTENAKLYYQLVTRNAWDDKRANYASDAECAKAILNMRSGYFQNSPDNSGLTLTWALNTSGGQVDIAAGSEYKFMVSYSNGQRPIGEEVAVVDLRTPEATGTVPTISIDEMQLGLDQAYKSAMFNIKATDAADIFACMAPADRYSELIASGMTDADVVLEYGTALTPEQVTEALSAGCSLSFSGLSENTEYRLIVMARGEGGKEAVENRDYRTAYYIDPSSTWSEITADAMLECGCFNVGTVQLHPLRVYENQDFPGLYKIDNPFVSHFGQLSGLPYGYMCHEDNDYDIIVDTRGGEVKIETYECGFNNTGLYTEKHGDICLASRALLLDDGSSYGWFDGNAICLGDISMYSPSEGVVFGQSGQSVLYLDSSSMPGSSPSLSTEEFTKNEVTVDW